MSISDLKDALRHLPGIEKLTMRYGQSGQQILNVAGKQVVVGPNASTEEIERALTQPIPSVTYPIRARVQTPTQPTQSKTSMSISSLREKLGKAKGVAQRVTADIEAEADSLIAEEDAIKAQTSEAFAPHKEILSEAKGELQAIKDALNLMTNGGPPLTDAAPIVKGS